MKWSLKWQIHLTLNLSHVIRNLILAKLWKIMACLHVWKLWFEERTNCHERYSWILKMKPAYQNSINGMNLSWNVVVDNMTRNKLQNTPILKDSFLFVHEFFINIDDNIIILNSDGEKIITTKNTIYPYSFRQKDLFEPTFSKRKYRNYLRLLFWCQKNWSMISVHRLMDMYSAD